MLADSGGDCAIGELGVRRQRTRAHDRRRQQGEFLSGYPRARSFDCPCIECDLLF